MTLTTFTAPTVRPLAPRFTPKRYQPWAWFDANQINASNGDRIAQWNDISGNARHVSQATAGKQPQFQTNVQGSKPGLKFSFARLDSLILTGLGSAIPWPILVFAVVTVPSTAPSVVQFIVEGSPTSDRGLYYTSNIRIGMRAGSATPTETNDIALGTPVVIAAYWADEGAFIRDRGFSYATSPGAETSPLQLSIGSNSIGSSSWDGYLHELIFIETAMSDAHIARMERYLGQKWSIPLAQSGVYYIDPVLGSNTNNGKFPASPKASISNASALHTTVEPDAAATFYVKAEEGAPLVDWLQWQKGADCTVEPWPGDARAYFEGSRSYTADWTSVGGGVYSRVLTFPDVTIALCSSILDDDGFAIRLTRNTASPSTPSSGEFGYDTNTLTLYVHLPGSLDLNSHTIKLPVYLGAVYSERSGLTTVRNITAKYYAYTTFAAGNYSANDDAVGDGRMVCEDCIAISSGNGFGSQHVATSAQWERCEAYAHSNDGFNGNGNAGVAVALTMVDCESGYNIDEGNSWHQDVTGTDDGGHYHHNGQGGITHVGRAHAVITNAEIDHNIRLTTDGGTGGANFLEQTSGSMTGCNVHDNPYEGIKLYPGTTMVIGPNTSGSANGNGLPDDLVA